jgi:hypothetical protein
VTNQVSVLHGTHTIWDIKSQTHILELHRVSIAPHLEAALLDLRRTPPPSAPSPNYSTSHWDPSATHVSHERCQGGAEAGLHVMVVARQLQVLEGRDHPHHLGVQPADGAHALHATQGAADGCPAQEGKDRIQKLDE